jgi:NADH-quinone oxidoreductase subunit C
MLATEIISVLSRELPDGRFEAAEARDGMPTINVGVESLRRTAEILRDAPELRFVFLADLIPVDYHPREPRFDLLYLLVCPGVGGFGDTPKRLRLRVPVASTTTIPSLSSVWASANWAERESFDFFGLTFGGHPDMRRILMPEDWEGFPMLKDYPVQINTPVKTYEPLQVTEEEFVANVEEARRAARTAPRPK